MHDIAIEPTAMARTKAAPANRVRSMRGSRTRRSTANSPTNAAAASAAKPRRSSGARVTAGNACSAETSADMKIASKTKPTQSNRPTRLMPEVGAALLVKTKPPAAATMLTPLAQKITRQSA
jgi:hypothetical protein